MRRQRGRALGPLAGGIPVLGFGGQVARNIQLRQQVAAPRGLEMEIPVNSANRDQKRALGSKTDELFGRIRFVPTGKTSDDRISLNPRESASIPLVLLQETDPRSIRSYSGSLGSWAANLRERDWRTFAGITQRRCRWCGV